MSNNQFHERQEVRTTGTDATSEVQQARAQNVSYWEKNNNNNTKSTL